jgi:hypothetical protein
MSTTTMNDAGFSLPEPINEFKNQALRVVGAICAVIGMVGLVMPVLPGVPFLILAGFCFEAIG